MSHRPDCPWENAECICEPAAMRTRRRLDDKRVCVHCLYCPLPAGVDVGLCTNCRQRMEAEDKLAAIRALVENWAKDPRQSLASAVMAILDNDPRSYE